MPRLTVGSGDVQAAIRPAQKRDAAPVASLITELGYATTEAQMSARLAELLADRTYALFVFGAPGRVVGVAGVALQRSVEKDGLHGRIVVLVVSSKARRGGIGGQLVRACERWARERGATQIVVTSGLQRTEAHEFYRRQGYAETSLKFLKTLAD